MNRSRLVFGVGINDADYQLNITKWFGYDEEGKQIQKLIWRCPFYVRWKSMLSRCYSKKNQNRSPTYAGCKVCEEWLYFSNFKSWMETQDWEGKQLDKDIILSGNKLYSPDTCAFVDTSVNLFMSEKTNKGNMLPTGVSFCSQSGNYQVHCRNSLTETNTYLGKYATPEQAETVYLNYKREQALILADKQTDGRVKKALIEKYQVNLKDCDK